MASNTKIASSAGKLALSAQAVYDLIKKSKKSSHTRRMLQSETKKISDICRSTERIVTSLSDSHQFLVETIDSQLVQCSELVQDTKKILDSLSGLPNIFRQTFRRSRVDVTEDSLDVHRIQLQQSSINLELCLHLIDIQVTYLATQSTDTALIVILDAVQAALYVQGDTIDKNIKLCAKKYLSDGTILYATNLLKGSDVESSNNSTPNASVIWKQSEKSTANTRAESIADSATISPSEYYTSIADTLVPSRIQDEFDDSQNTEPDYHLLAFGKEAMLENDFGRAEEALTRCSSSIEMLPKQSQDVQSLNEIRLLLAICAFHLRSSKFAQTKLTSAIGGAYFSSDHAETRCEALRCLTVIYMRLRNPDQATLTCEALLRQTTKFIGNGSKVYWIFALLVNIYEVQKDNERANAYLLMIPTEDRPHLLEEAKKTVPEMVRVASPSPKSLVKSSGRPQTPHLSIKIDHKLSRQMRFCRRDSHLDNNILAIAWSHDNCLIAIGFNASKRRIELRRTATEEILHTLDIGIQGGIQSITFDRSTKKVAAVFRKDPQHKPGDLTDCNLRIWDVKTGQEIWSTTVLSGKLYPALNILSFNPFKEDQLLLDCRYSDCTEEELIVYDTASKTTIVHTTHKGIVGEAIWTEDVLALSGCLAYVTFNTMDYRRNDTGGEYRIPYTLCSGQSPSGQLWSMNFDGSIRYCDSIRSHDGIPSYSKGIWTPLPSSEPPVPLNVVKDAYLGFNKQGTMVILLLTYKGDLYLRAPTLRKWITVASGVDTLTHSGLSPDGCYAYFTTWHEQDDVSILHILNIEDCLGLPSSSPEVMAKTL